MWKRGWDGLFTRITFVIKISPTAWRVPKNLGKKIVKVIKELLPRKAASLDFYGDFKETPRYTQKPFVVYIVFS